MRHHDCVHGPGARARDRFDGHAPVFEQGIEHTPRKGTVSPAALQGQAHGLLCARPAQVASHVRRMSITVSHRASCRTLR